MQTVFAGKKIIVGVTGSIAAFKVAGWVSDLAKEEADVSVIMTQSGMEFVTPLTFAALAGRKVHSEMFGTEVDAPMTHINLGREADLILVAPATANTLAKLANGFADNLLCTTVLASRAQVLICPAMNSRMYSHPATKENIKRLKALGYKVLDPAAGLMACKEEGEGRLAEWDDVKEYVARALSVGDLQGVNVLISAGPTREPLDPARYLSNRSSGKMGYALARAAFRRGAHVTLVSGPTTLPCPVGVERLQVQTADEMYDTVISHAVRHSIIIKAAAVADYKPVKNHEHKVKKDQIKSHLELEPNKDILLALGKMKKSGQILVGFAAESQNLRDEGLRKLKKKNLDIIAVNDISTKDTGFEVENNQVLLITKNGEEQLPFTSKLHTANLIWNNIIRFIPA